MHHTGHAQKGWCVFTPRGNRQNEREVCVSARTAEITHRQTERTFSCPERGNKWWYESGLKKKFRKKKRLLFGPASF